METKTFTAWRYTATWSTYIFSGVQWYDDGPQDRDTQFIEMDIEQMMGYDPEELKIKWEKVEE